MPDPGLSSIFGAKRDDPTPPRRVGSREAKRRAAAAERAAEEQLRRDVVAAIPQRDYIQWSGRQAKILNEQETRYGIPCGRAVISVPQLVRWIHDAIADGRIRDVATADAAAEEEWARRRIRAQALREELALARDRGDLVALAEVIDTFDLVAGRLAAGAERILEECGETGAAIYASIIADVERTLRLRSPDDGDPDPPKPEAGDDRVDPPAEPAPTPGRPARKRKKAAKKKKPGRVRGS